MEENENGHLENQQDGNIEEGQQSMPEHRNIKYINGMYKNWFLDYASYVILERAVPLLQDGLKPVQRRILHAMRRIEDGRYNKVANIIGYTMQYHPHGDASIGEALVQLGQKNLLIDTQGNWGNYLTGDNAAAPRYIEARLSKFALEVAFNPKTTEWKPSYDGRNKEPVSLPMKFPLLLAQGVEGIAVGLASKILPHNFNELIQASILHLQGKKFELYPDFPTGGFADFSKYNDGIRGGRVRVRAKISILDRKTLVISEIPYGKTTNAVIDSIVSASDKGKIKIKKVDDNTAANVEILVHLAPGVSPDMAIDALYAFTDCEISISPNACIIDDEKPRFIGISEILKISTVSTVNLLRKELEIRKSELEEDWHMSSLEKIFIENKIYSHIEECETWEAIIETIDKGLKPFKKLLRRVVTRDDIVKLTEIKIKRISKYDAFKADEHIKSIEEELKKVLYHIEHIIPYSIEYFKNIKKKYGKDRDRKTEIRSFDTIEVTKVVVNNVKLYANKKEGFVGTSLKKDEFICECSDIDDIIVFLRDGRYMVTKVSEKSFVGKNIIHIDVFKKNDDRTIYNAIYYDGGTGNTIAKRFAVTSITRDRFYDVTKGAEHSKISYFSSNPNGEAEILKIILKPKPRLKKPVIDFDFSEMAIKGRGSIGNIITKHAIHKIILKKKGESTLGGCKLWFDHDVLRLNTEERGVYLGEFFDEDKIIVMNKSGYFSIYDFDMNLHFENNIEIIEKFDPQKVYSVAFYDGEQKYSYLKRFIAEETEKQTSFIGDHKDSKLIQMTTEAFPRFEIIFGGKDKHRSSIIIDVNEFIGVKSYKARGKRISTHKIKTINQLEPLVNEEKIKAFKEEQINSVENKMNKPKNPPGQGELFKD